MAARKPNKSGSVQEQVSECVRCARRRPLYARGLCVQCYTVAEEAGQLERYPDSAGLDWIDYQHLRSYGVPIEDVAERLQLEIRTALRYERRRRGANYDRWLATLTGQEWLRYGLPGVTSTTQPDERPADAHNWLRTLGAGPECDGLDDSAITRKHIFKAEITPAA